MRRDWQAALALRPREPASLRQAAELETGTPKPPVTPAPTLPAHELLGDLLLEQGRAAEALEAYQRSLKLYPGRRNSLRGVEESSRARVTKKVTQLGAPAPGTASAAPPAWACR